MRIGAVITSQKMMSFDRLLLNLLQKGFLK